MEVDGEQAELVVSSAGRKVAGVDGDARRTAAVRRRAVRGTRASSRSGKRGEARRREECGAGAHGHGLPSPPVATAACGMGAEEVAAWRQCALSPLCFVRNFPEGSGKFRLARNRSGKIRVIPNDQKKGRRLDFIWVPKEFHKIYKNSGNNTTR